MSRTVSYVECFGIFAESRVVGFHKVPSDLILGGSFIGFTRSGGLGRCRCCCSSPIFTRQTCCGIAIRRVQALGWDEGFSLAVRVWSTIIAVDSLTISSHSKCRDQLR